MTETFEGAEWVLKVLSRMKRPWSVYDGLSATARIDITGWAPEPKRRFYHVSPLVLRFTLRRSQATGIEMVPGNEEVGAMGTVSEGGRQERPRKWFGGSCERIDSDRDITASATLSAYLCCLVRFVSSRLLRLGAGHRLPPAPSGPPRDGSPVLEPPSGAARAPF